MFLLSEIPYSNYVSWLNNVNTVYSFFLNVDIHIYFSISFNIFFQKNAYRQLEYDKPSTTVSQMVKNNTEIKY